MRCSRRETSASNARLSGLMSAVVVMAAQHPLGFDGTQMARKASEFKIIPACEGCGGWQRRRPERYEPPGGCKLLNFRRIFWAVTFRTSILDSAGPPSKQQRRRS